MMQQEMIRVLLLGMMALLLSNRLCAGNLNLGEFVWLLIDAVVLLSLKNL
jgi:hypothetical protein